MNRLPHLLFTAVFSSAFAIAPAVAQKSSDTMKSSPGTTASDTMFLKKAAQGGMAEVELGQLAEQKAVNQDVKDFAKRMVDDHSKANDQLKVVAQQEHVNLPHQMSSKDQATKAKLEQLSGQQFDQAYMEDMVKDHKADVAEFQHESKSANDSAVKNFAQATLPVLQSHLRDAERIAPTQAASRTSGD